MVSQKRKSCPPKKQIPTVYNKKLGVLKNPDNLFRLTVTDENIDPIRQVEIKKGKKSIKFDASAALFVAKRLLLLYRDSIKDVEIVEQFSKEVQEISDDFFAFAKRTHNSPYLGYAKCIGPLYIAKKSSTDTCKSIDETCSLDMDPIHYKYINFHNDSDGYYFKKRVERCILRRDQEELGKRREKIFFIDTKKALLDDSIQQLLMDMEDWPNTTDIEQPDLPEISMTDILMPLEPQALEQPLPTGELEATKEPKATKEPMVGKGQYVKQLVAPLKINASVPKPITKPFPPVADLDREARIQRAKEASAKYKTDFVYLPKVGRTKEERLKIVAERRAKIQANVAKAAKETTKK